MASKLFGSKVAVAPHLLPSHGLPGEIVDLRKDVEAAFLALQSNGGLFRTDEFTNPETATTNWYLSAKAGAVTAQVITSGFAHTAIATGIPRSVTVSRTSSAGAYTTSVITVKGTCRGVPVTLTFTPGDANGGDTIASNENLGMDTITEVDIPLQVSTAGAFNVGFGAAIALKETPVSRAGLVAVIREVSSGAVVTTGTFAGPLYTPAAAPNGTRDYAVTYEAA